MQILAEDICVFRFEPADGSPSAAVKVSHRTTHDHCVDESTASPRDNFRIALRSLVATLNPHPDHIPPPELMPFDLVKVQLPESTHEGQITRLTWNTTSHQWQYFAQCSNHAVSTWYEAADLQRYVED